MRGEVSLAWSRFIMDAARWVRPQEVASTDELNPGRLLTLLYRHPSLRAMAWFRLASVLQAARVKAVPSIIQRRLLRLYGLELLPGADIGGGLYIAHPSGCTIVVASMGENVSIMGSVTFGRTRDPLWPTVGNEVFVGAGARVLGPIKIGDGVEIGANAVVLTDVDRNERVVGVPARPLPKK
jgi:serine O-acetyltransferase